jgi:hypothetical protein
VGKSVLDFLDETEKLKEHKPIAYRYYEEINNQASRHVARNDFDHLYKIARPAEDQIFTEWRGDNKRHITTNVITRYTSMLSRVLMHSFVDIRAQDELVTEILKESYLGRYSFDDFRYKILMPLSFSDPNALVVEFPINPNNPHISLMEAVEDGGLEDGVSVGSKEIIVPYHKIIEYTPDYLVWTAGKTEVGTGDNKRFEEFFIAHDKEAFYTVMPYKDNDGSIVYTIDPWYAHEAEKLFVTELPAQIVHNTRPIESDLKWFENPFHHIAYKEFEEVVYRESVIFPALPHLDEAIVTFSSSQANQIRHMNSILSVDASIECPTCKGAKVIKKNYAGKGSHPCPTCNGTGTPQNFGQFSTVHINTRGRENTSGKRLEYITPDTANIPIGRDIWKEHIDMAEKALCVNPLEGHGNESGYKGELRLEPKQDIIREYGEQWSNMCASVINNKVLLREGSGSEDIFISLPVPITYSTANPNIMLEEAMDAPIGVRPDKFMKWVQTEYKGNSVKISQYRTSILYAPLMLFNQAEIRDAINTTAWEADDVVRATYSLQIYDELFNEDKDLGDEDLKVLFAMADDWLIEKGLIQDPEAIIAAQGADLPANGAVAPPTGPTPNAQPASTETELSSEVNAGLDGAEQLYISYLNGKTSEAEIIGFMIKEYDITEEQAREVLAEAGGQQK